MNKITIIGGGNIGLSLAKGLVKSKFCAPESIMITRRSLTSLEAEKSLGFQVSDQNATAIDQADFIVLAILPQHLRQVLDELQPSLKPGQTIISVVSGVSCADIKEVVGQSTSVVRAMPNTAIAIGQSMTCIASDAAPTALMDQVSKIFESVGSVVLINEDLMTSATALCACGIAFFLRSIRAASQGGVEIGFHAHDALKMAIQTAKGAADLLLQMQSHPESEIDKVTSPKGCTIAGLNEMEHNGFSSAFIKGIKVSAKKAGGLYND
ncbi:MAG: pyrroline-5-carboxylate reductase [Sphingobacterium sp.]